MNKTLNLTASACLWTLLAGVICLDAQTQRVSSASADRNVKGGGTTGQLPKWTSPETIGDSIVTESNGNIGIGTTTPGSKLTVAGRIEAFTSGSTSAVLGQSETGSGVRGNSNSGPGVFGSSATGRGVQGLSQSGDGLFGFSQSGNGVRGDTSNVSSAGVLGFNNGAGGTGVSGQAFFGTGVRGISSSGFGVFGSSDTYTAVEARSDTGFGIFGSSNTNTGIHGQSGGGTGVFGGTNGVDKAGVHGVSTGDGGKGVLGEATSDGTGVRGNSDGGIGVFGFSASITGNGVGVYGLGGDNNSAGAGHGVLAEGGNGIGAGSRGGDGIIAFAGNGANGAPVGRAGVFFGDVVVAGTLSKSGGSFRIDHPLDPANKYLSHSFVESPDMMNIYNGNVITDENGDATVTLPDYFAALNRDFRYQLTVIGQFAQAIVSNEINGNRFTIKTDKPGVKVSWQVTGIRQDPWADQHRIKVEETKSAADRGFFLHPELYGQPEENNIIWAWHPDLMKRKPKPK